MEPVRVLEWVRHSQEMWTLPRALAAALDTAVPGARVWAPASRDEAEALLPEADVVLGWAVRPHNFARARRLRWVHSTAASVTHVLFPELVASDVQVTNARGIHADSMAEHTIGVLLAFARKLHRSRDAQRERTWGQDALWAEPPPIGRLAGTTLGVIGLGKVGSAIAERGRAMGMHVLAVRRHPVAPPEPAHEQWGVERLPDLLAASDWVVIAAPHTAATTRLVGARELAAMKPGARLVNLGRGEIVDEAPLVEALRSGRLAGAALDVFEREPLPAESPLWAMPEVIVTPHTSGLGPRYWERVMEQFVANLRRFVAGEPLENLVDKRAGY
jgi:phosphoglycerate dehydrogenase-like enzyme